MFTNRNSISGCAAFLGIALLAAVVPAIGGDFGDGQDRILHLMPDISDDEFLEQLASRDDWEAAYLYGSATDARLAAIAALPGLRRVDLFGSYGDGPLPTAEGLLALAAHPGIQSITAAGPGAEAPLPLDDAVLSAWVGAWPELESLSLRISSMRITLDGLEVLAGARALRKLALDGMPLDDDALASLARHCPDLTSLQLALGSAPRGQAADGDPSGVTERGWLAIGHLKNLEELTLSGVAAGSGLLEILARECPSLRKIVLHAPEGMDGFGLEGITAIAEALDLLEASLDVAEGDADGAARILAGRNPDLRRLRLYGGGPVTEAGLMSLAGAERLEMLWAHVDASVGDGALRMLAGLRELRSLRLLSPGPAAATAEGVRAIAGLPALGHLQVDGVTRLDADAAAAFAGSPLFSAIFPDADLDDEALAAFAACANLRRLDLPAAAGVSAEAVARFARDRPDIQLSTPLASRGGMGSNRFGRGFAMGPVLHVPMNGDTAMFRRLMGDRRDWKQFIAEAPVEDEWMELLAECAGLELAHINNWQNSLPLTSAGLSKLAACPELRELHVYGLRHPLTEEAADLLLEGCPELQSLAVGFSHSGMPGPALPPGALMRLAGAANLRVLHIQGLGDCDDRFLEALAENVPGLESLMLIAEGRGDSFFGHAGLSALARLPNLESLTLPVAPEAGDSALMALAAGRPHLRELRLYGSQGVTAAGLAALADCPLLESIDMGAAADVGDGAIAALAAASPMLLDLSLVGADAVTDAGLAALVQALPGLRMLRLGGSGVTDAGLERLGELANLQSVFFGSAREVTDQGLLALARAPNLHGAQLPGSPEITEAGVAEYRRLKPNGWLYVPAMNQANPWHGRETLARDAGIPPERILRLPHGCTAERFRQLLAARDDWQAVAASEARGLTDAWLEDLADACPDLRIFQNLFANPEGLTSEGMGIFARFPKLNVLELCSANTLRDAELAAIFAACPELEHIRVCDSGEAPVLTDEAFLPLWDNFALKRVFIRSVKPLGPEALLAIAGDKPELEELHFDAPVSWSDRDFAALGEPLRLRRFWLGLPDYAGDEAMRMLTGDPSRLEEINLMGASRVTDAGLRHLSEATRLRRIWLLNATELTDAGLEHLAGLPALREAHFQTTRNFGDAGMAALGRIKTLAELSLHHTRNVTGAGLAALAEAGNLRVVDISESEGIDDAGITAFARLNPGIRDLRLRDAREVSDAALDALAECPDLAHLDLAGARRVTAEGIARFRQRRPGVEFRSPRPMEEAPAPRPEAGEAEPGPPVISDVF